MLKDNLYMFIFIFEYKSNSSKIYKFPTAKNIFQSIFKQIKNELDLHRGHVLGHETRFLDYVIHDIIKERNIKKFEDNNIKKISDDYITLITEAILLIWLADSYYTSVKIIKCDPENDNVFLYTDMNNLVNKYNINWKLKDDWDNSLNFHLFLCEKENKNIEE